ncbi:MAG: type II secretion system F family protein [Pseudoxanthomonas suwonensis]|nr:type II secretion system F family protein [Pseudoxanthomonas suwonensis]
MPLYQFKAVNAQGELVDGEMEAANEREVALRLQQQGQMPVEARLAGSGGGRSLGQLLRRRPLAGQRLVQFTQQLATLLQAGQPLDRALGTLLDLPEDEAARRSIGELRDAVRGGASLSSALERQQATFGKLYINMVRAGEAGGSLQQTLARLADYMERAQALRGRVTNALVYPVILLVMVSLSLLFLLGFVVPQFAAMYESLDAGLPWFSQVVLSVGMFVRDWWLVMVVLPLLALWWFDRRRRDPVFRLALDRWLLGNRFSGPLVAKMETARLARTLGTLLHNGVPLLSALGIARGVLGNQVLADALSAATEQVRHGSSLASSLARHEGFPRLALQMVQVGEESGQLDAMLLRTADTFENETGLALDRLLAALVPVLTLFLALVVGVVILAVLVPIYDLTSVIG